MPISKNEAIETGLKDRDIVVNDCIVAIDAELKKGFQQGDTIDIPINQFVDGCSLFLKHAVIEELISRYSAVGWTVTRALSDTTALSFS